MKKMLVVMFATFSRQIKSIGFIFLIFAPFIILGISGLTGYISANGDNNINKIAIISNNNMLRREYLKMNNKDIDKEINSIVDAKKALKDEKIVGFIFLKVKDNKVQGYFHGNSSMSNEQEFKTKSFLNSVQNNLNLNKSKLNSFQLKTLKKEPSFKQYISVKNETGKLTKMLSFWVIIFVIYIILLTYSSLVAQEISADKGTKIIEVIFSSTLPRNYFIGKVFGIFLLMITQIIIYFLCGMVIFNIIIKHAYFHKIWINNKYIIDDTVHNLLNINMGYLILGVIIFMMLSALCGALVSRVEDSSKAALPSVVLCMIAFLMAIPYQDNSTNLLVKIFSFVPFFSSFFMPLRIINHTVNVADVIISMSILIVSIIVFTIFIMRIFANLMLQNQSAPIKDKIKQSLANQAKIN